MSSQVINIYSGWRRVYTDIVFEGATKQTPVLIDTGSSELAVCPGTEMGNARPTGHYASCAYGDGSYGWVGEWYEGKVTFGTPGGCVTDSKPMLAAAMNNENAHLCTPHLKGILGVDFGGNTLYTSPQKIGEFTGRGEVYRKESFATTMLNPGDDYTMAFIGVTPDNSGQAVIAFGSTAEEMLSRGTIAGSTLIIKSNTIWYTLKTPMTVSFRNVDGLTDKITFNASSVNYDPIIDSGTPCLVLPNEVQYAMFAAGFSTGTLPSDAIIVIEMPGGLVLELPLSRLGNVAENVTFGSQPILGFPVFWIYDIKFQTQKEVLSFYSR